MQQASIRALEDILHYITHGGILLWTIKETVATKDRRDNLPSGIDSAFAVRAGLGIAAPRVGAQARQDPNAHGCWGTVHCGASHWAAPQGDTGGFFCNRETSVKKCSAGKGFQSAQEPPRVTHLLFPHKQRMISGFN